MRRKVIGQRIRLDRGAWLIGTGREQVGGRMIITGLDSDFVDEEICSTIGVQ